MVQTCATRALLVLRRQHMVRDAACTLGMTLFNSA